MGRAGVGDSYRWKPRLPARIAILTLAISPDQRRGRLAQLLNRPSRDGYFKVGDARTLGLNCSPETYGLRGDSAR